LKRPSGDVFPTISLGFSPFERFRERYRERCREHPPLECSGRTGEAGSRKDRDNVQSDQASTIKVRSNGEDDGTRTECHRIARYRRPTHIAGSAASRGVTRGSGIGRRYGWHNPPARRLAILRGKNCPVRLGNLPPGKAARLMWTHERGGHEYQGLGRELR
jgi:hypothetical protein